MLSSSRPDTPPAREPRLRVLSLGAGVQSTTLALLAAHGEVTPMPDCAIFSDTGWEPAAVYDHLGWLMSGNILPFPVHIVSAGNIRDAIMASTLADGGRFASLPFHTREILPAGTEVPVYGDDADGSATVVGSRRLARDEYRDGMSPRQCTKSYKLEPLVRKQRELLGYAPRRRIPPGSAEVWIGISTDEAIRMKPARHVWQVNRFPLVELRMSRADCLAWLERHGYPVPPKSACIGCPFHSDAIWRDMRQCDPASWRDAVEVDHALRANGPCRGMRGLQYLHSARKPLEDVDLASAEDRGQLNLFLNECEGLCGV